MNERIIVISFLSLICGVGITTMAMNDLNKINPENNIHEYEKAYKNGWNDAMKEEAAKNKYAEGYHAALKQFTCYNE